MPYRKNGKIVSRRIIPFSWPHVKETVPGLSSERLNLWRRRSQHILLEDITYFSDGLKIKGYLVQPKRSGKYPCIIFNRGGSLEFGSLGPLQLFNQMVPLAEQGYVVVGSQYRGCAGSEGHEEFGGRDLNDILNLIPLLQHLPLADTKRLGMLGWSRGGMMTYLTLKKLRTIKAAVVGGGEADLVLSERYRPEMKRMHQKLIPVKSRSAMLRELQKRSAVYWPEKIAPKTPILILHGSSDWRVRPEVGLHIASQLVALGHPVRFVLFDGADHGIREYWEESQEMIQEWFDRFLKRGEKLPNTKLHGP